MWFDLGRYITVGGALVCVGLGMAYFVLTVSESSGLVGTALLRWAATTARLVAVLSFLVVSVVAAFFDRIEWGVAAAAVSAFPLLRLDRRVLKVPDEGERGGRVSRGTTTESVVATGDFVGLPVGQVFVVRATQRPLLCQADQMKVVGTGGGLDGSTTTARIIGQLDDGLADFKVVDVGLPDPGARVELAIGGGASKVPEGALAWKCGVLAESDYPVYLDLGEAITHNTLVVGTTGSRKTSFVVEFIKAACEKMPELAVVVLDVTGQWQAQLGNAVEITKADDFDAAAAVMERQKTVVEFDLSTDFETSTAKVTKAMFDTLVEDGPAGGSAPPRVVVVLEEAHVLVPEGARKEGEPTRRVIAQGRKYGLGFVCITQRTASVTKDVTALCNTLVALRAFDETTRGVVSAYVTSDLARVLPTLPDGRALVAGRGVHPGRALIVKLGTQQLSEVC